MGAERSSMGSGAPRGREAEVWAALQGVTDPEIPVISVVEMGMIAGVRAEGAQVWVEVTPTFVGCPAIGLIQARIEEQVRALPGVEAVTVTFVFDPHWSSDRITPEGREKLTSFGIAPPSGGADAGGPVHLVELDVAPACPYCGSSETHLENLFGPTACRSIYYCDRCRQPFEAIKSI
jgi:ring-1,2-phenylacetyl-CoA epoxidase subunit PaaD